MAVHDGLGGPFSILDFAEARSIGFVEYRDGAIYVQDPTRSRSTIWSPNG